MFEKATKTVIDSAKNWGTNIYSASKEQGEIAGLKVQKSVVEKKLEKFYAVIGKRYYEYINNSNTDESFDVMDVIEQMQPEIEKMKEIDNMLLEKELNEKKQEEERKQKKALEAYEAEKTRLDKALEMDVINQEEYDEKIVVAKKKYENYEQLRKIEMQLKMGIINREEYELKIKKILY